MGIILISFLVEVARPLFVMTGRGLDDTIPFFGTNVETDKKSGKDVGENLVDALERMSN
jgi:hypothetical protein